MQDKEDIKELKKDQEDLVKSRAEFKRIQRELNDLRSGGGNNRNKGDLGAENIDTKKGKGILKKRQTTQLFKATEGFTIINKEVVDYESFEPNSQNLPETDYFPGTKWLWNKIDLKRLLMKDVEESVNKVVEEATTLYSMAVRNKQKKLVKRIFRKKLVQFEIKEGFSEKRKKLTRLANAIIIAARKMKGLED